MIIKKIEICNFRIFYKENVFEFIKGLNLILGWHGDGKTTLFDALEWLFRTDGINMMDTKFISKKRCEELFLNDSDEVRVAMTYEHEAKQKVLEKHFLFTKSFDGEVNTSNYTFSLVEDSSTGRIVKDGIYFDNDLPSEIRKFMMFKGEEDLNIMEKSNSLKLFVDSFGDVNNFNAYFDFMEYATRNAEKARDHALMIDKKCAHENILLKKTVDKEKTFLADVEREIFQEENVIANFDDLLKTVFESKDASKLLAAVNGRIEDLRQKRAECLGRIKENYNINLLSSMWILLGFKDIAEEYSAKVNEVRKLRRKLETDYWIANGVEQAAKLLESGKIEDIDYPDLYKYNYVLELPNIILKEDIASIEKLPQRINEVIAQNERLHNDVSKIETNLETEFEHKKRILAQSEGFTEEQLLANYDNISNWIEIKRKAERRIDILKLQREQHRAILEKAEFALSKISEGTTAEKYAKTALLLQHISNAFKKAKEENKRHVLNMIEDKANMFLQYLYSDDYTGVVRMIEKQNGQVETFLMDGDGVRVFCPSYSLKKAYLLSLQLSIGEVLNEKNDDIIPLIINDSVSIYDEEDENKFFSATNRQMIVLTSDYLTQSSDDRKVIDVDKLNSILCTAYRIEKKRPFDNTKLGTMQTTIYKIK